MRRASAAWQHFWFTPEPTSALALFRIAFGLVVLGWTLSLLPDLQAFYSGHGIEAPPEYTAWGVWGLLGWFPGYGTAVAVYIALIVGALGVIAGYRTRLASLIVFVGVISMERRTPGIFNSGDGLLRILALLLVLAPAGESLSVDRWRRARDRFWEFPARAPWALRLIQVQVSVVYLGSVWGKLHGAPWRDGTAVAYSLQIQDFQRFAVPDVFTHSMLFSAVSTYGTIAIELMLAVLIWNRAARPLVLALGVSLHTGIDLTLRIGFFSAAILTAYVVFVPPTTASAVVLSARDRIRGLTVGRRLPAPA